MASLRLAPLALGVGTAGVPVLRVRRAGAVRRRLSAPWQLLPHRLDFLLAVKRSIWAASIAARRMFSHSSAAFHPWFYGRAADVVDLSERHQPVPFLARYWNEDWRGIPAQRRAVEHYRRYGYVSGVNSRRRADRNLQAELAEIARPGHPPIACFTSSIPTNRPTPAGCCSSLGLAADARLSRPALASAVCRAGAHCWAAVRFWHDQLFCKPARHGGVVAWHGIIRTGRRGADGPSDLLDRLDERAPTTAACYAGQHAEPAADHGLAGDMDAIRQCSTTLNGSR